jgi:SAM-dependent methyltransferase
MVLLKHRIYLGLYAKIFPALAYYLTRELRGCRTVLDLGCGENSPLRWVKKSFRSVGVETFQPAIEISQALGIHDDYVNSDVLAADFPERSFDAVLALDLIEHLPHTDGLVLLERMERFAARKVIVFTPNGFLPQDTFNHNPFQEHKSGWTVADFRSRGYRVLGINGLKPLRGRGTQPVIRPRLLGRVISDITRPLAHRCPELAFQLLCIKDITA